jgi:hypothetical protein
MLLQAHGAQVAAWSLAVLAQMLSKTLVAALLA